MADFEAYYDYTPEELVERCGFLGVWGCLGVGRALAYLPRILIDRETVLAITRGFINLRPWLMVFTDLRIILLSRGYVLGLKLLEIPLASVKMVYHHLGPLFGEIVLSCGEIQARLGLVNKKSLPSLMTILAKTLAGEKIQTETEEVKRLNLLERLARLKNQGALTEAEFLAQKKKILSGR
ncbi:MAG: PH domain-containing protein [Deltaproteobacteria bacterium]|jgi:hypothetical protein|nr:PH domain-containing protein [Deltaproteobacteria bacterium]